MLDFANHTLNLGSCNNFTTLIHFLQAQRNHGPLLINRMTNNASYLFDT